MPLTSIGIDRIKANFRGNPHNNWGKPGGHNALSDNRQRHAMFRIHRRELPMWLQDSDLKIEPGALIFAMGSCFAREIEHLLAQRGFTILSRPPHGLLPSGRPEYGTLNRYNTPSMLLEFRRLLEDPATVPDEALLICERPGIYADAHYHNASQGTLDEVLARRRRFLETFKNLVTADVIVLTLGLNEVAFEVASGLYRNISPTINEIRRGTGLEVHTLTVRENVEYLEAIRALIRTHCHKNPPIVITVSPVPLGMTYLLEDIVAANGAAKAALRAAANEFSVSHSDVHYFPSYEIALNSAPSVVFTNDKRHINQEFVDHIIGQFVARYVTSSKGA